MLTSYFSKINEIKPPFYPVCIARNEPKFYRGALRSNRRYEPLMPSWAMLRMAAIPFDRLYEQQLALLDPVRVFDALGEHAVLIAWEAPDVRSHRRMVAEWLEEGMMKAYRPVEITELGFDRSRVLRYRDMPRKNAEGAELLREQAEKLRG